MATSILVHTPVMPNINLQEPGVKSGSTQLLRILILVPFVQLFFFFLGHANSIRISRGYSNPSPYLSSWPEKLSDAVTCIIGCFAFFSFFFFCVHASCWWLHPMGSVDAYLPRFFSFLSGGHISHLDTAWMGGAPHSLIRFPWIQIAC